MTAREVIELLNEAKPYFKQYGADFGMAFDIAIDAVMRDAILCTQYNYYRNRSKDVLYNITQ